MPAHCDEVIPGRLWVGEFVRPDDVDVLKNLGITAVVSLQSPEDLIMCGLSAERLTEAFESAGIEFRRSPVRDFDRAELEQRLPACVAELTRALDSKGARVYLHCTAGVNRSPTVAAAYLVRARHMSAREALEYVSARHKCSPYSGVLENYESWLDSPAADPQN